MQDEIKREISIKASKERVYNAIADRKQLITWFPIAIEGDLAVGQKPLLDFGEHGKTPIYVTAMQPHEYFAYRWVPGGNTFEGDILDATTTLVEFRITETAEGCTVTVTESGFSKLPPEIAEQSFKQNSGGWEYEMGLLEKKLKAEA